MKNFFELTMIMKYCPPNVSELPFKLTEDHLMIEITMNLNYPLIETARINILNESLKLREELNTIIENLVSLIF